MADDNKKGGRKSLSGEGGLTPIRHFRLPDETWNRWQALAKASGFKGGCRELVEEAVKVWEAQVEPQVLEKAEKILELEASLVDNSRDARRARREKLLGGVE